MTISDPQDGAITSGSIYLKATLSDDCALQAVLFELRLDGALIDAELLELIGFSSLYVQGIDLSQYTTEMSTFLIQVTAWDEAGHQTTESVSVVFQPETDPCTDGDGDGYGDETVCPSPRDCDDQSAGIHPDATEIACDGVDQDCLGGDACTPPEDCDNARDDDQDGKVDCDDPDCDTSSTWYRDADDDGVGAATSTAQACAQPAGYVSQSGDCDDSDANVNPSAQEVCDGIDNDCNPNTPDPKSIWYLDSDGDGACGGATTQACTQPQNGCSSISDCDDSDSSRSPTAIETCDSKDNDCDGQIDDGVQFSVYYIDSDGDSFGSALETMSACKQPPGTATNPSDCNDHNAAIHPGAEEVCNQIDEDCDQVKDEGFDSDSDGVTTCLGDCDDSAATVYPGAPEVCDGMDNDCLPETQEVCELSGVKQLQSDADVMFVGEHDGDSAGVIVSGAGDVNGDGYDDILVAAASPSTSGAVYLILGPVERGTIDLSTADTKFVQISAGNEVNQALKSFAGVGDLDRDGYDDIALGDWLYSGNKGGVYVFYGRPSFPELVYASSANAILVSDASSALAGCAVSSAGDVNRDGFADFLVGAYYDSTYGSHAGTAYLIYGGSRISGTKSLSSVGARFYIPHTNSAFGLALSSAGDTNKDGYSDFVVGAPYFDSGNYTGGGAAFLFLGRNQKYTGAIEATSAAAAQFMPGGDRCYAGWSVSGVSDVNGDGFSDLLIGGYNCQSTDGARVGATFLIYGPVSGGFGMESVGATFFGPSSGSGAGFSATGLGDFNGDSFGDLLIGAFAIDAAYLVYGRANIYGTNSLANADASLINGGGYTGISVAPAGDVNADGRPDLLIGARYSDVAGPDSGSAFLYYGRAGQ